MATETRRLSLTSEAGFGMLQNSAQLSAPTLGYSNDGSKLESHFNPISRSYHGLRHPWGDFEKRSNSDIAGTQREKSATLVCLQMETKSIPRSLSTGRMVSK